MNENWRDRCDWCNWPLKEKIDDGCTAESCSLRPMPISAFTEIKQDCRKAEKEVTNLKSALEDKKKDIKDLDDINTKLCEALDDAIDDFSKAQEKIKKLEEYSKTKEEDFILLQKNTISYAERMESRLAKIKELISDRQQIVMLGAGWLAANINKILTETP